MHAAGERRASLPETVGAWLKIWTPPRDVVVPEVPVRKLLIGAAVLAVVIAAGAAVLVPRIEGRKDRQAAEDARRHAQQRAAARLRAIHDQRPQRLHAADLRPAAGAAAAKQVTARVALVGRVRDGISADTRRRVAAGELHGHPGATTCHQFPPHARAPERDLSTRIGVYDCLVVVAEIKPTETNVGGTLGYPFRAVLDFRSFEAVWCKTNPVPGEQIIPDPRTVVQLPRECRSGRTR